MIEECNFKHKKFNTCTLSDRSEQPCLGEDNCILYQIYKWHEKMAEEIHPKLKLTIGDED